MDLYLITGAGILSEECVTNKKILNIHPGIIPIAKGLDAFKWSILNRYPLGITLHYIDENVDAGEVISVIPTPVFSSDTIEILARRHYENEITAACNFEKYLTEPVNAFINSPHGEPKRRMPLKEEQEMLDTFSHYLDQYMLS